MKLWKVLFSLVCVCLPTEGPMWPLPMMLWTSLFRYPSPPAGNIWWQVWSVQTIGTLPTRILWDSALFGQVILCHFMFWVMWPCCSRVICYNFLRFDVIFVILMQYTLNKVTGSNREQKQITTAEKKPFGSLVSHVF